VNNAIKHGNRSDIAKAVQVRLNISGAELTIRVIDEGGGFDIEGVPNPVNDDNLMREVGRGIFIVKNFVDDVRVSRLGGGTCVEIVKKRA
jgi:serine/threonine-protein kinase RsbW